MGESKFFFFPGYPRVPDPYLRNLAEWFESGVKKKKSLHASYNSQIQKNGGNRLDIRRAILLLSSSNKIFKSQSLRKA